MLIRGNVITWFFFFVLKDKGLVVWIIMRVYDLIAERLSKEVTT